MENSKVNEFFASANGFSGFRSNFENIFIPEKIDRLFILKGGPGTGKSTLMRKISERFINNADITHILCSSDPSSLDGIIIEKNGHRVAIADGTSPHVLNANLPGIFEILVDLGEGFILDELDAFRDEIIYHSEAKRSSYRLAYSALNCAGEISRNINDLFYKYKLYSKAVTVFEEFIKREISNDNHVKNSEYYLSAFCKDGHIRLPILKNDKNIIYINGDGYFEHFLMSVIKEKLTENNTRMTVFKSTLSDGLIERIETSETVYALNNDINGVNVLDIIKNHDEYEQLKREYDDMLRLSINNMKVASEHHFELEKIYSRHIYFELNNRKSERIFSQINKILHL